MGLQTATIILWVIGAYLVAGVLFAVAAQSGSLTRIEKDAKSVSLGVRTVLVPGMVLLWPLLVGRILKSGPRGDV